MGAGMILGKKQAEEDTDLYFWREFAALLGDDDVAELCSQMIPLYEERMAARRAGQAQPQTPPPEPQPPQALPPEAD